MQVHLNFAYSIKKCKSYENNLTKYCLAKDKLFLKVPKLNTIKSCQHDISLCVSFLTWCYSFVFCIGSARRYPPAHPSYLPFDLYVEGFVMHTLIFCSAQGCATHDRWCSAILIGIAVFFFFSIWCLLNYWIDGWGVGGLRRKNWLGNDVETKSNQVDQICLSHCKFCFLTPPHPTSLCLTLSPRFEIRYKYLEKKFKT